MVPTGSLQNNSRVPFAYAVKVWARVGIHSFGGPAGQIAVMHKIVVDEEKWISEERFLHALNYCMLLPGPEAQQLATYLGWLMHGVRGGLVAGVLFILPGFLSILGLSLAYTLLQDVSLINSLFFGLKAAVVAIVLHAVSRIGKRVLHHPFMVVLAIAAFVGIFLFNLPFPIIVGLAAIVGWICGKLKPEYVIKSANKATFLVAQDSSVDTKLFLARSLRTLIICLLLWIIPFILFKTVDIGTTVFFDESLFFSKAAVVTFGGAYSVLSYLAQQAVDHFHWLHPGEMLDGLAMAETTPGPLIMVVQFVGFMGAYRNSGVLDPVFAGVLGSMVTVWVTFVPCFLWIFLGAPYIEKLRGNQSLQTALSAITASVVGVILNLAIWFSMHTIFSEVEETSFAGLRLLAPELGSFQLYSCLLSVAATIAIFRFQAGMFSVLCGCAIAGVLFH